MLATTGGAIDGGSGDGWVNDRGDRVKRARRDLENALGLRAYKSFYS
jgi:hypothetical protein